MKKLFYFSLVLTLVIGLAACSSNSSPVVKKTIGNKETADREENTETVTKNEAAITLNTYTAKIEVGEKLSLEADSEADSSLKWKSSNESVALVNSNGIVTGAAEGVANITCYADGAADAVCTVTVEKVEEEVEEEEEEEEEVEEKEEEKDYDYDDYYSDDFIFPHSSRQYLSEQEIHSTLLYLDRYSPSGNYAQDAINEIYARNGYVFQEEKIGDYYNDQSWYSPDRSFTYSDLNDYEVENIELLQEFK